MTIWNKIQIKLRALFFIIFRKGKVKEDISIFCNNCIGAFVAHDYHLPFNSPTVNLMIPPSEFIEYIEHLDIYKDAKIEDISEGGGSGRKDCLIIKSILILFIIRPFKMALTHGGKGLNV